MEIATYHKLCKQVKIVGFIKNNESKSCLRNGHLETCHGGNFLLYYHLLGNICCWKHLKLKINVDQTGPAFLCLCLFISL